jgi:hypothetical protein
MKATATAMSAATNLPGVMLPMALTPLAMSTADPITIMPSSSARPVKTKA